MRKVLLVTAVALAIGGCAAQQPGGPQSVQVRDLSMGRNPGSASSYTVQAGDTLYGIAWRNEMDFRRLAQLNGLQPPYRLEPGQQLRLTEGGVTSDAPAQDEATVAKAGVDQAKANATQGAQQENPDWLAPDEETIRRNQGIVVRPLEGPSQDEGQSSADAASSSSSASSSDAASDNASSKEQGPGPIYNYGSPGADGKLSQRDQSEREALQKAQQENEEKVAIAGQEPAGAEEKTPAKPETQAEVPAASQAKASQQRAKRTYAPTKNIDWQWPTQGKVVHGFGEGASTTAGIDIAGQKGQPVKAAGPGIVVYAGSGVRGYGNLVLLKHNDQFLSAYAHNDKLQVRENDVVEAGEVIATMGDTDADSVILHFEVRKGGQPQNPMDFLPKR